MKKRLLTTLFLLCLLPTLLTGCWQEESIESEAGLLLPGENDTTPAESQTVLPAAFSLPYASGQTLDPITCPDGMQQVVGSLLYEGLFRLDTQLEPQNLLCGAYTYDPAACTYVFTLRTGIAFSDGTPLTAAHVAATLERARTSERYRARLYQIQSVSADGDAVTVVLSGPNVGFPALLDIPIVKSGTETSLTPIGTGPYVLTDGALEANAAWWQGSSQPVARIGLMETADRDAMLYQFTSHDVQLITADLTGTAPISVTGSVSFQDADTTILQYVGFNTRRAPFDSAALRAALGKGINRASVVSAFLSGHGAAAQSPVSPVSPLYPAGLDAAYSYDAFAAAMESAGFAAGASRTVTLLVNEENSFKVSVAQYLAEALSAFDLQVEVKALPWAKYTAALAAGNFDLYYGEVKLTADWNLVRLVGTSGSLNYGGWSDIQTDLLLTEYAAATDRSAALSSLCAYLQAQAPILPVCFKSTSVLVQTGVVEGLSPTMTDPFFALPSYTIHLQT